MYVQQLFCFCAELHFVYLTLIPVGLVVDLTNTTRWYDSKTLTEKDIKYVKINCKGRSETPNEEQTRTFIQVCSNFIAQNPLLHVGVHCTHGFNRTGFLIAAYLVEKHDWGVDAAVQVDGETCRVWECFANV